ncbi:MAG: hypothetical protein ACK4YP_14740, partial [Myxococcota bacterium]
ADEAAPFLAETGWAPDPPFEGEALRLGLHSLACLARRPDAARASARAALARPVGTLPCATARVEIDAGHVLVRVGDRETAARAASRALLRLDDRQHRALVVEACRLAELAGPDAGARARLQRLTTR